MRLCWGVRDLRALVLIHGAAGGTVCARGRWRRHHCVGTDGLREHYPAPGSSEVVLYHPSGVGRGNRCRTVPWQRTHPSGLVSVGLLGQLTALRAWSRDPALRVRKASSADLPISDAGAGRLDRCRAVLDLGHGATSRGLMGGRPISMAQLANLASFGRWLRRASIPLHLGGEIRAAATLSDLLVPYDINVGDLRGDSYARSDCEPVIADSTFTC